MKRAIKTLAHRLGFWRLAYRLRRKPILAAFTFHRVTDHATAPEYYLGYDRGLDVREFRGQLDAIGEYFTVISLDEFRDIVLGHTSPREHSALLTFDDADSEFIAHVLPALQERNWPAVVFTPTGYVGTDKTFWHVRIGHLYKHGDPDAWRRIRSNITGVPESILTIIDQSVKPAVDVAQLCRLMVSELNKLNDNDIEGMVSQMMTLSNTEGSPKIRPMNWEEHRKLTRNSVSVQSHTASHRRLGTLSVGEVTEELRESKKQLEERLGQPVYAVCYPQGSYDERVIEIAPSVHYALGFTTQHGLCEYPVPTSRRFCIPRVGVWSGTASDWHWSIGRLLLG